VLPCDYGLDAARRAPPVNWVRYLRSIWGQDIQSIELVHQLLGYLLSGRHDLQKIFVLLGPPRAGKGTLLNLIGAIFGEQATSFKVASLDQNFSMQSMLGKTIAYDPDVRRASSMFKSEGQMVERLLSISAHDIQVIPRKNQTDIVTALPARLLLAANPPFGLTDVGGALATRFVILTFPRSFLGQEDLGLGGRLAREIPSIVALALDGMDKLDSVGHFVEPASSQEERESVERAQNPMLAFVDDL
jgi:putative DNA primase/helicase